jgi:hypothetical protein
VYQAILVLERNGPAEGRPLADSITASRVANMKELRPPSTGRREIRILLVSDPWRSAVCRQHEHNSVSASTVTTVTSPARHRNQPATAVLELWVQWR